jgi:phage N-6-adenine-methyltransferase
MNNALMFSSKSDEWSTPQEFFDRLHAEFDFDVDLAASRENHKCRRFITAEQDALTQDWGVYGDHGWLNPPYSRGLCAKFIAKAGEERRRGFLTVMLLPARTDTIAFHAHIYDETTWQAREGVEIRLLRGRLKFGGAKDSAPFPSMLVVFRP